MNKLFKNKDGSDKPIEIFVALFIILAVAMILLKMFSGQVADKSNELNELSKSEAAKTLCGDKCSAAKGNNCRDEDLIAYCVSNFKLDINKDKTLAEYDSGAFKLCEDKIYCPLVNKCECGADLTMAKCLDITKKYYQANGILLTTVGLKYSYTAGACSAPGTDLLVWTNLYNLASYTS